MAKAAITICRAACIGGMVCIVGLLLLITSPYESLALPTVTSEESYRTGMAMLHMDPLSNTHLVAVTPADLQAIFAFFHGKEANQTRTFTGPHNETLCAQMRQHVKDVKPADVDRLVLYVHGFAQKWDDAVHLRIRDALFTQKHHKVMLVVIDARTAFGLTIYMPHSSYLQSSVNTRTVGAEMGRVAHCLTSGSDAPFSLNKTHLIGFSLGGHTVGMAGAMIQNLTNGQKVARITGLDPAGPWFSKETDLRYKLSPDDADFVDVVHTSWSGVWGFGTDESLGHIDFYPQGPYAFGVLPATYMCIPLPVVGAACEHMAAQELFIESIYRHYACTMKGWRCASWAHFTAGLCDTTGENSVQMGYFLTKEEWLATQKSSPSIGEIVSDGISKVTDTIASKLPTALSNLTGTDTKKPSQQLPANDTTGRASLEPVEAAAGASPASPESSQDEMWNFGMQLVQYFTQTMQSNSSATASDGGPGESYRLLERLPVIGQFFLSNEDEETASVNDPTGRGLNVKKSKNNYYLHVRKIYPYCVSEVEQLRMVQPETCSEHAFSPMPWMSCVSRKLVKNPKNLVYDFFSAFKSYGNIINKDIG